MEKPKKKSKFAKKKKKRPKTGLYLFFGRIWGLEGPC